MHLAMTPTECECGTDMRLVETGTEKTLPLIGTTVPYREYECPDCGEVAHRKLDVDSGEWIPV